MILPWIQTVKNRQIHIDKTGHMKSSYHIFVLIKIHSCLSPNTAVHLGKQRCGNLNEINPSQIGSCCITGKVSYHTTAEGENHIPSLHSLTYQETIGFFHCI